MKLVRPDSVQTTSIISQLRSKPTPTQNFPNNQATHIPMQITKAARTIKKQNVTGDPRPKQNQVVQASRLLSRQPKIYTEIAKA